MLSADYIVDKSGWGPGPWQNEPDRVDFVHAGLACFALRHFEFGQWCGYVGVPREHPLYGHPYQDVDLEAHGGLTYSDKCDGGRICHVPAPGMPDDVWWFGFDCAHCGDLSPGLNARTRAMRERGRAIGAPWADAFEFTPLERMETYRDLAYVRREIAGLADQLARFLPARMLAAAASRAATVLLRSCSECEGISGSGSRSSAPRSRSRCGSGGLCTADNGRA